MAGSEDVYRLSSDGALVRRTSGLTLFDAGEITSDVSLPPIGPYHKATFAWGKHDDSSRALALAVLHDALGERTTPLEDTVAWQHHEAFSREVLTSIRAESELSIDWIDVQRWFDKRIGSPDALTMLHDKVDIFERRLEDAVAAGDTDSTRYVDPRLWKQWDIQALFHHALAHRTFPRDHLPGLIDALLDVKFKLCCLLEADLEAYERLIKRWSAESDQVVDHPRAHMARLSGEATIAFKVRATWESVMNAVFWAESGKNARFPAPTADSKAIASKKGAFFRWANERSRWRPLTTFKQLVTLADEELRTPEAHASSTLRSAFTWKILPNYEHHFALLRAILHYVWDHLVIVVAFARRQIYYDASRGTEITIRA